MRARGERGAAGGERIDNLRRRWHPLHVVPIAAALGGVLLAAGAVTRPAASLAEARRAEAGARRQAIEARAARKELTRFGEVGGFERVAELEARLAASFPDRPSAVELHAALVLAARGCDVALDDVHLGGAQETGLEVLGKALVLREALIDGRAHLGELTELIGALEAAGYPVVVRRVAIERAAPDEVEFGFALELGIVCSAPPALRATGGERVP